jgi:hypothetical protein
VGCIDELPLEVVPDPEGEVQGRTPILAQQLRYALLDYGVKQVVVDEIHYDRFKYNLYEKSEIREILHSHQWMREMATHREHRKCTDFAEIFQAVCLVMMPSVPLGTIEYWLVGKHWVGHKVVIFFQKRGKKIPVEVFLVDPLSKQIWELNTQKIDIIEITM